MTIRPPRYLCILALSFSVGVRAAPLVTGSTTIDWSTFRVSVTQGEGAIVAITPDLSFSTVIAQTPPLIPDSVFAWGWTTGISDQSTVGTRTAFSEATATRLFASATVEAGIGAAKAGEFNRRGVITTSGSGALTLSLDYTLQGESTGADTRLSNYVSLSAWSPSLTNGFVSDVNELVMFGETPFSAISGSLQIDVPFGDGDVIELAVLGAADVRSQAPDINGTEVIALPVGTADALLSVDLKSLDGVELGGQIISLDVLLGDGNLFEFLPGSLDNFSARLMFSTNYAGLQQSDYALGYLLNADGTAGHFGEGAFHISEDGAGDGAVELIFGSFGSLSEALDFSGVQLAFTLPMLPDHHILDASLVLDSGDGLFSIKAPPQPTPLGEPWTTTGTATRLNSTIEIGREPSEPGTLGPGTATLAAGATDAADEVLVGQDSLLTVTGAGTRLISGIVSLGAHLGATGAQAYIQEGGVIETPNGLAYGEGSGFHVSGAGSRLLVACETLSCAEPGFGTGPLLDLGDGSESSVTSGGEILIDGGSDADVVGAGLWGGGRLDISGTGSKLRITGGLDEPKLKGFFVHGYEEAPGVLSITEGGQVIVEGEHASTGVAFQALAAYFGIVDVGESNVTVDGAGSLLDAGELLAIGDSPTLEGPGGVGTVIVRNGGVVRADLIYIGERSTVSGNGGTLEGTVEVHGTLAPGESPGSLSIVGDLELASDGRLVIELGGTAPGEYDVLNVTGTANLAGTLEIRLVDGFLPGTGESFDFLTAGFFAGAFESFVLPSFGDRTLELAFGPGGFTATVVPLPAALPLLLSALGGLGGLSWRRQRAAARG